MSAPELSAESRSAIFKSLNRRQIYLIVIISGALTVFGSTIVTYISSSTSEKLENSLTYSISITNEHLSLIKDSLSEVKEDSVQYTKDMKYKIQEIEDLKERVTQDIHKMNKMTETLNLSFDRLNDRVKDLTTDEISYNLGTIRQRTETLSTQVDGIQKLISPSNASQILNVASMNNEILARKEFEKQIRDNINSAKVETENLVKNINSIIANSNERITSIDDDVRDLLFWILGIFVTLVGGLIAAFAYLGKKISDGLTLAVTPASIRGSATPQWPVSSGKKTEAPESQGPGESGLDAKLPEVADAVMRAVTPIDKSKDNPISDAQQKLEPTAPGSVLAQH